MQNKGIVKFIAIVLILVCCFYLSFSFVRRCTAEFILSSSAVRWRLAWVLT